MLRVMKIEDEDKDEDGRARSGDLRPDLNDIQYA
jgi:hypothetical protein